MLFNHLVRKLIGFAKRKLYSETPLIEGIRKQRRNCEFLVEASRTYMPLVSQSGRKSKSEGGNTAYNKRPEYIDTCFGPYRGLEDVGK